MPVGCNLPAPLRCPRHPRSARPPGGCQPAPGRLEAIGAGSRCPNAQRCLHRHGSGSDTAPGDRWSPARAQKRPPVRFRCLLLAAYDAGDADDAGLKVTRHLRHCVIAPSGRWPDSTFGSVIRAAGPIWVSNSIAVSRHRPPFSATSAFFFRASTESQLRFASVSLLDAMWHHERPEKHASGQLLSASPRGQMTQMTQMTQVRASSASLRHCSIRAIVISRRPAVRGSREITMPCERNAGARRASRSDSTLGSLT